MNAPLILNDAAGAGKGDRDAASCDQLCTALRMIGIHPAPRVAPPAQLCDTLRAAAANQPEAIFVAGGDGTASAAAGVLAGTGIALGVLPLGTLNHFARDLGLPPAWREAIAALADARRAAVDVGEVNGRVFINNCSIGSYAEAVRKRDALRQRHGAGKWGAMAVATFRVFRELRRMRLLIDTSGGQRKLRAPFLVVANNRYRGHVLDYSLRPRLDEGKLWFYTTRAHRHLAILRLVSQSLLHRIDDVDGLEQWAADAAEIAREGGRPLPVALDGELADVGQPLRFRCRAGALHVLVPRQKHGAP